jgi:hypothetical protein
MKPLSTDFIHHELESSSFLALKIQGERLIDQSERQHGLFIPVPPLASNTDLMIRGMEYKEALGCSGEKYHYHH